MITKVISLIILFTALVIYNVKILASLLIVAIIFFLLQRISFKEFFKRVIFIIPFLFFLLIFNFSSFPLIALKSITALISTAILTKNFDVGAISRWCKTRGIPTYIIEIFLLGFRFSHTFVDEVIKIKKSLFIRGSFKQKNIFKSGYLGPIVGNFFLQTYYKSEKVHQSMKLRGY